MDKKKKGAKIILKELKNIYPDPKIALNYSNNLELLVATILSARATDKKVNEITQDLFEKYKNVDDYADANIEELQKDIQQIGFYRSKADYLNSTAQMLRDKHDGKVPDTMDELTELKGVARKTANVILGVAFGKEEGVVVDTHIRRLSQKYGLTTENNPVKIEKDLMEILPEGTWTFFALALVLYGREHSPAHKKKSTEDPISQALIQEGLYPKG